MHINSTGINNLFRTTGSALEKIGKKTEQAASKLSTISSQAEIWSNKFQNFDSGKLESKLNEKYSKISNMTLSEIKNSVKSKASSLFHKLDSKMGGELTKFCEKLNLPVPMKSVSDHLKSASDELRKFGKEGGKVLDETANKVANSLADGISATEDLLMNMQNKLQKFQQDGSKTETQKKVDEIKAKYARK